jgi:glycine betaine/proline transport system ATP-binding protein
VVDSDRHLVGLAEVEEVARLAERNEQRLGSAVDGGAPKVGRRTSLREVLPLFVEDGDAPVAVVDEEDHLEGVIVRGSLIAGLTTSTEPHEESGEDFSGVGVSENSQVRADGGGQ